MDDDQARELEALEVILSDPCAEPIKLSYGLLKFITENFSNKIGHGGFGAVYKGCWQNGVVAVKKIFNTHEQISDQLFMDEINCLKSANHKNIVRFLGYCADTQEEMMSFNGRYVMAGERNRLLCFEYVPNGNIQQYLEEKPDENEWHIRHKIIRGICEGLHYFHEKRLCHLDLKPDNVMLDDCMEPKITDFGLSRFLDEGKSTIFTENVRGTLGYIAPEMITRGHISLKSDIYALGIIIIKLLTGRNIIDFDNWHQSLDLDNPQVTSCIEIARSCIEADQDQRPTIGDIIRELDEIESMLEELKRDTAGSSTNQMSLMAFPRTEHLDVYPLELTFLFKPSQQRMQCQLSLINKTDVEVGFFLKINLVVGVTETFNGILTPMSTGGFMLRMFNKEDEPLLLDKQGVLILMFTMRSKDDVRGLMRTLFDKEGELNISMDDLYKQVQILGGKVHRATLGAAVAVVPEHDKRNPTFMDNGYEALGIIRSATFHPTKPWILMLEKSGVSIWDWQTKETMHVDMDFLDYATTAKFIARKQWFILIVRQPPGSSYIYVYTCRTLNQVNRVMKIKIDTNYDVYDHVIEVHRTRPFVLLYKENTYRDQNCMIKLFDWDQNWSCTREFSTVEWAPAAYNPFKRVVVIHPKDTNSFITLGKDQRVKIWKFDRSEPIATLEGLYGINSLHNIFTYRADQHLVAAITGANVEIWDLQEDKCVHALSVFHRCHFPNENIVAVACHPTRPVLATASSHGYILVWCHDTYRLKELVYLGRIPRDIAFVGLRRLMLMYEHEIQMLDIDLK